MGKNDSEARAKLGEEVWSILQEQAGGGGIGVQKLMDIATLLGKRVLGEHLTRMELVGRRVNFKAKIRDILGDWWIEEMSEMVRPVALKKLVDIFKDPSVNLKPCAAKLKRCLDQTSDKINEEGLDVMRPVMT